MAKSRRASKTHPIISGEWVREDKTRRAANRKLAEQIAADIYSVMDRLYGREWYVARIERHLNGELP